MATPTQIQSQEDTPLDDFEREIARQILGVTGVAGDLVYDDSDTRLRNLDPTQNKIARALIYVDWEEVGFNKTLINGDGVVINPEEARRRVREEMRRLLYPMQQTIDEVANGDNSPGDRIGYIEAVYRTGSQDFY